MSLFSDDRGHELRDLFFESATELLQVLNEQGLELERRPGDPEIVRSVRRTVHTLKGDSAACGFQELSSLAHTFEDALTQELAERVGGRLAEVVLSAADIFDEMLQSYRMNSKPPAGDELRAAIQQLLTSDTAIEPISKSLASAETIGEFQWSEYQQTVITDALQRGLNVMQVAMGVDPRCEVRAAAIQLALNALQELGNILVQDPEDGTPFENQQRIQAAIATSFDSDHIVRKCKVPGVIDQVLAEPAVTTEDSDVLGIMSSTSDEQALNAAGVMGQEGTATGAAQDTILRVDAERIDAVLNLVGEMILGKSMLTQTIGEFDRRYAKDALHMKFADVLAFQARVLNDLQKSVMKIRMVPVEQLFRRFPRIVRDVAKTCDKEVRLTVSGQDTDLDKSILDALAEPIAHLVRNAIAHGIEPAADRLAAGKPAHGTVSLNAYHQGNEIVIEVSDDGAGIDQQKIVGKALESGIISSEEAARLTEAEALNLIFHSGLSTADQVTSISGRGVGMDIVRSVLGRLKGAVRVETQVGVGTQFYLKVPLTLAIIKALMFRVTEKLYAVPLNNVVEITRTLESEVHIVDQREVIRLRNEVLPLIRLNPLTKVKATPTKKLSVVVVTLTQRKFGLIVDRLVGEEELVIKALDDHLVATELVSGASILGDGTVVLILNLQSVISRLARVRSMEVSA